MRNSLLIVGLLLAGCADPECESESFCFDSPQMSEVEAAVAENPEIVVTMEFEAEGFSFTLFEEAPDDTIGTSVPAGWKLGGRHVTSYLLAVEPDGTEHYLQGTGGSFRVAYADETHEVVEVDGWGLTFDEAYDRDTDGSLRARIKRVSETTPLVLTGD